MYDDKILYKNYYKHWNSPMNFQQLFVQYCDVTSTHGITSDCPVAVRLCGDGEIKTLSSTTLKLALLLRHPVYDRLFERRDNDPILPFYSSSIDARVACCNLDMVNSSRWFGEIYNVFDTCNSW